MEGVAAAPAFVMAARPSSAHSLPALTAYDDAAIFGHMTRDEGLLLGVAGRLFREKGFQATTVRDIATAAGMLPGSLHYRFPTKEALLVALMERGMARAIEAVRVAADAAGDPVDALRRALGTHLRLLVEGDDAIYVNLYELRSLRAEDRDRVVRLRDSYEALWDGMLHRAAGAGQIGAAVDLRMLRYLLLGAVNWSAQWYRPDGSREPEEIADAFITLVIRGCRPTPPNVERT